MPDVLSISPSAARSLRTVKGILARHPAFALQELSFSVLVEFLCDYWESGGKLDLHHFQPRTRPRGRPPGSAVTSTAADQARPATVRKAGGLTNSQLGLPPQQKPD